MVLASFNPSVTLKFNVHVRMYRFRVLTKERLINPLRGSPAD